ncbi:uncharacterized protein LOC128987246 [Macrosteles quadrilineatus]|uniref:uncharacterized protein LOC128987246 n=1 Tax=Macrosteles quadrilineatus TaxID=74068 RepID=UPI0023E3342D|nr:uncharacterized protein LOC128987246 [Macrosteles quadrilineatus]
MVLFQDNPLAFLLSTAVLLITTSCFLAISISLHSAYLWLAVVFVALIFLATFTCTYSLPGYFVQDLTVPTSHLADSVDATSERQGHSNLSFESETNVPYWIHVDLPPDYDVVVGINPPSYSKATGETMKLDLVKPTDSNTQGNDQPPAT